MQLKSRFHLGVAFLFPGAAVVAIIGLAWARFSIHHGANPRAESPQIEISAVRLDLGSGKPGEILRGQLKLSNIGSGPLDFSIVKSCSCTELIPADGTITPGGSQYVTIGLKLSEFAGSVRTAQLTVKSNDPNKSSANCEIVANCPSPFHVSPTLVDFGAVSVEELPSITKEIRVVNVGSSAAPLSVHADSGPFTVTIESSEIYRIRPERGLNPGTHYGSVLVLSEASEPVRVRVPIRLSLSPSLMAVPSTVICRREASGKYSSVECILVSENANPPLGNVKLVAGSAEFSLEELGQVSPHRKRLRLVPQDGWTPTGRTVVEVQDLATLKTCDVVLISSDK